MSKRAYEVVVYDGPLPALFAGNELSAAEQAFVALQSRPVEWARHCAEARAAWHKRTGVKPRGVGA